MDIRSTKGHQFFALRVDSEFQRLLTNSLTSSLDSAFSEGTGDGYYPELEAAVSLAYYWCSYVLDKPTPGMAIFQLSLQKNDPLNISASAPIKSSLRQVPENSEDARRREKLYKYLPLLVVLAKYVHCRLEKIAVLQNWRGEPQGSWKNRAHKLIRLVETCFRVAGVVNTLVFLWYGVYPTLLQRISGAQMVNTMCDDKGIRVTDEVLASMGTTTLAQGGRPQAYLKTPAEGYSPAQVYLKSRQVGWSVLTQFLGTLLWVFDWPSIRLAMRVQLRRFSRRTVSSVRATRDAITWWWRSFVRKVRGTAISRDTESISGGHDSPGRSPGRAVARGATQLTVEGAYALPAGITVLRYDCHCCRASPAESPYVSNCGHIYCYTCLYNITQGFTARKKRWGGLLRRRKKSRARTVEGGDVDGSAAAAAAAASDDEGDSEAKALDDPFQNSLGIAYVGSNNSTSGVNARLTESVAAGNGTSLGYDGGVSMSRNTSVNDFIDYTGISTASNTGVTTPANELEGDVEPYICPACDGVVITGERFSLR